MIEFYPFAEIAECMDLPCGTNSVCNEISGVGGFECACDDGYVHPEGDEIVCEGGFLYYRIILQNNNSLPIFLLWANDELTLYLLKRRFNLFRLICSLLVNRELWL